MTPGTDAKVINGSCAAGHATTGERPLPEVNVPLDLAKLKATSDQNPSFDWALCDYSLLHELNEVL